MLSAAEKSLNLTAAEQDWLQQHPIIRFTGDPNWLPFEAFDSAGNYIGIVAEHLALIEQKLDIKFERIPTKTWTESVNMAKSGTVDVISETDDSALKSQLLFTRSYVSNPVVIVMGIKHNYVEGIPVIRDKSIGVIKDYGYVTKIVNKYQGYNFEIVENIQDGLIAVSTGRVDALLCTVTLCGYTMSQLGLHDVKIVGKTEFDTQLAFGVTHAYADLVPILNKAISSISAEQRQKILDKWSLQEYVEKTDYTLIGQILTAFLLVFFLLAYRQHQLRKYSRTLALSEARYARAVKGTSDGLWDRSLADGRTYYSPRFNELLGFEENELSENFQTFVDKIHPDDLESVNDSITKHLVGESSFDLACRILNKDGHFRWYRLVGQAELDEQKKPIRMAGALSDITEQKMADSLERSRNRILELTAKGESLQIILDEIVASIENENPHMLCSILLLDDKGEHLHNGSSPRLPEFYVEAIDGGRIGEGVGSCGTAAFTGKRVIVKDIQKHPYWKDFKEIAAQANLASCWSEPIFDSKDKVLGTFAIYQTEISLPDKQDILIIEEAAKLAGIAIEKLRVTEELKLASTVYQNSSEAMLIFNADRKIISVNPAFTKITGYQAEEVLGEEADILNSEFYDEDFYQQMSDAVNKTGYWQGEVRDRRKDGEIYVKWLIVNTIYDADGNMYRRLSLFSDITQKKESEEIIWKQANFDFLTGLPNRSMFHERLITEIKRAKREKSKFALLLIDLDHFKEVNDTLGHDVGDTLLIEAANRIKDSIRETDIVARLGGDEFTILVTEIEELSNVERVALLVNEKLSEPFLLGDEMVYVSASIGITLFPNDSSKFDTLLKNADQAMYEAKNLGRNRYQYFTSSMQEAALERMYLINDLRDALKNQEFSLYYQPIVNLQNNLTYKAEALIRWHHPQRGLVNPQEFISVAEETGLIVEIGDWVLRQAAQQVKLWREQFTMSFQVSINTSPMQYQVYGIDHQAWSKHFQALSLPGEAIIIEITEGLMMDASEIVTGQLLAFRNAGIQVALDDFGTGYSSLSYLKRFDIDYIKIDRMFVQNLETDHDDRALCEAIVVMAHKLNLLVIAEGVETQQQKHILQKMGCDYAQGFLFSRPLPVNQFEKLL